MLSDYKYQWKTFCIETFKEDDLLTMTDAVL